jgi:hypothetical protein
MTTEGLGADTADGQDTDPMEVCITTDAPLEFAPKAVYALEELLAGVHIRVGPSNTGLPRLHYGLTPDGADVHLPMHPQAPAFFERVRNGTRPSFAPLRYEDGEVPVPFLTDAGPDVVASAFYWLSGWDEYTRRERDVHGRVTWEGSVQQQLSERAEPYVDIYRDLLRDQLSRAGFTTRNRPGRWHFCVTHDIDYLRKWTPGIVMRTKLRWITDAAFRSRFRMRTNPIVDASYRMLAALRDVEGQSTWFFKAAAGDARDVYYSLKSRKAKRLLRSVRAAGMEIGLHPAYQSVNDLNRLREERERLEDAAGLPVMVSRQHYLRTTLPYSARLLEAAGFSIDATLGFPDAPGFRHGTTHPFRIFDIAKNAPLNLIAVPLAFMDASLFNTQKLDFDRALAAAVTTMKEARRHGGVCVGLWHNVLWEEGDYPRWGEHFERCLAEAVRLGGTLTGISKAVQAQKPSPASIRVTST